MLLLTESFIIQSYKIINCYICIMRKLFLFIFVFTSAFAEAQNSISPFYKIGEISGNINGAVTSLKNKLNSKNYQILGEYNPLRDDSLYVIAFTNEELITIAGAQKNKELLAAILKIGIYQEKNKYIVSIINPQYIFSAFLKAETLEQQKKTLAKITDDILYTLKIEANQFTPYGGTISSDKLPDFSYNANMPTFNNPYQIKEFQSFSEGLTTIRNNLDARKGKNIKVFEIVKEDVEIAIFGIGMNNDQRGDKNYLLLLGKERIASMPYELILIGNNAFMLDRAYRLALFFPEVQQSVFSRIISGTRGIEEMMQIVTK